MTVSSIHVDGVEVPRRVRRAPSLITHVRVRSLTGEVPVVARVPVTIPVTVRLALAQLLLPSKPAVGRTVTQPVSKLRQWGRVGVSLLLASVVVAGNFSLFVTLRTHSVYTVRSGSMEPALATGSVILVSQPQEAAYAVGDIITYHGPGYPITHRVIEVAPHEGSFQYRTQGDANQTADKTLVPHERVLGATRWHVPILGYLLSWLKTKAGFSMLILLPATLVLLHELRAVRRAWQELAFSSLFSWSGGVAMSVGVGVLVIPAAYAALSATVQLTPNQVATAALFPSPSPTPSTTPTPTPTTSPEPSPTPSGSPVPSSSPDPCAVGDVTVTQRNEETGPDSVNENETTITRTCTREESTRVSIETDTTIEATTGGTVQSDTTSGGGIHTGDISISTSTTTVVE